MINYAMLVLATARKRRKQTKKSGTSEDAPPFRSGPAAEATGPKKVLLLLAAGWDHDRVTADRYDDEVIAAVALPALLVVLGADRTLFTVADEVEPAGVDAMLDEVLLRGGCTTLTEGQVVLIRAALVGVAFDAYPHSGVGREPRDLAIECRSGVRTDIGLVEVEVDRCRDGCRVDDRHCGCYAGRISRCERAETRVRAHCRCDWRRRRRSRRDATRIRGRNILESSVRAHDFRTRATDQQAESSPAGQVEVLCILVVIRNSVNTKCNAVCHAEANAGETADTVVVLERATDRRDRRLGCVVRPNSAEADDELGRGHDRNVVVHAQSERRVADVGADDVPEANIFGILSLVHFGLRVLAIALELPVGVGEENAYTSTETDAVFGQAGRLVIEMRPLAERADLQRSRERRLGHVVERLVRHVRAREARHVAAAEKRAWVQVQLQSGLRTEIRVRLITGESETNAWRSVGMIVDDAVDSQRGDTEPDAEPDVTLSAVVVAAAVRADDVERLIPRLRLIGLVTRISRYDATGADMDRSDVGEREAVANSRRERAVPDLSYLAGSQLLGAVIAVLSLEIPVRCEESADAATNSDGFIELQRVIVLCPLAKAAY